MALLLLVVDEPLLRSALRERLVRAGHSVQEAGTLAEAEMRLRECHPQVVVVDMDGKGIELLSPQREHLDGSVVIAIAASLEDAVTAMRLGATDLLAKPVDQDELLRLVDKATQRHRQVLEVEVSRRARERELHAKVIAESAAMARILEIAASVASAGSTTVLIQGETGTGKEILARSIHAHSPRACAPLEALHCAAIPEHEVECELFGRETDARSSHKGLFELADGGTVILDEIGGVPMTVQAKLVRFLEKRSFRRLNGTREIVVDVRVIATTSRALRQDVAKGRFHEALFHRLEVFPIEIPPLRERREDILPLAIHFMKELGRTLGKHFSGMSCELREKLMMLPWTANVLELRNLIERSVLLEDGDVLTSRFLPIQGDSAPDPPREEPILALEEVEFIMVQRALKAARGNQSQAARLLQVSRDQLRYRVKRYRELGRLSADLAGDAVPA